MSFEPFPKSREDADWEAEMDFRVAPLVRLSQVRISDPNQLGAC